MKQCRLVRITVDGAWNMRIRCPSARDQVWDCNVQCQKQDQKLWNSCIITVHWPLSYRSTDWQCLHLILKHSVMQHWHVESLKCLHKIKEHYHQHTHRHCVSQTTLRLSCELCPDQKKLPHSHQSNHQ